MCFEKFPTSTHVPTSTQDFTLTLPVRGCRSVNSGNFFVFTWEVRLDPVPGLSALAGGYDAPR